MGRGHYYPRNAENIHYRMVNLAQDEELGYSYDNPDYADDEGEFHTNVWLDLIETIQDKLRTIAPTGRCEKEWGDDALVIYRTPLLDVTLTDNDVLFAIVVKTRNDLDGEREANLAPKHIDRVAQKLFSYLKDTYGELDVPYGGYTSGVWNGDVSTC